MRPSPAFLALAFAASCALSPAACAAESYDGCTGTIAALPAVIATQGVWCLKGDLATTLASGDAIRVTANNVTIDCNRFKLGGLGAGPSTLAVGIRVLASNATVRQCHVRGFYRGIVVDDLVATSGHIVEDNRVEASRSIGILVYGDTSTIRRNLVIDTGGDSGGTGILAVGRASVLDNTVDGVSGDPAHDVFSIGIWLSQDDGTGGVIADNRVSGLVASADATETGIYVTSDDTIIRDNAVTTLGGAWSIGIRCNFPGSTAVGNVVTGPGTAVTGCYDGGNVSPP